MYCGTNIARARQLIGSAQNFMVIILLLVTLMVLIDFDEEHTNKTAICVKFNKLVRLCK